MTTFAPNQNTQPYENDPRRVRPLTMRLLLVMPNVVSYGFLRELGAELCADGTEVHLACSVAKFGFSSAEKIAAPARSPMRGEPTIHPIEFARGMNPIVHLRAARRLKNLVERLRPDLVHAHFDAAIFTTALARTARWPATIATFHGLSFPSMTGWRKILVRWATTWAARKFGTVLALNGENRDLLRAVAPAANVRMLGSVGVGCSLTRFAPPEPAKRYAMRTKLGFCPDDCVFTYVGRLVEIKGFALAVRAFFQIAKDVPHARLLIVGCADPMHASGLVSEEEAMLKASPRVVSVGYSDAVEEYLAGADVLVLPSFREGVAVCLMEALAMGIPVLTRDVCGCREVGRNDVDGIVLRDCTVETIAAAMKQLADSPDLRQRMSDRALADRDRLSVSHFIREQRELYETASAAFTTTTNFQQP